MLENIRKTVIDGINELITKGDLTAAKLLSAGWHDKHVLTDEEYTAYTTTIAEKEAEITVKEEAENITEATEESIYELG